MVETRDRPYLNPNQLYTPIPHPRTPLPFPFLSRLTPKPYNIRKEQRKSTHPPVGKRLSKDGSKGEDQQGVRIDVMIALVGQWRVI